MAFEIEIKLRLPESLAKIRRILREQGFRVVKRRSFETNVLFDNAKHSLRRHGKLIRIRRVGGRGLLTFKGPSLRSRHKKREEIEIEIDFPEPDRLQEIFDKIGFHPVFRYEKYRTEYAARSADGKIMLDETPIGNFLEIEGSASWIDRTSKLLGFKHSDYLKASYGYLYRTYRRGQGKRVKDMLFRT
ncbi:MAG TPA: class IV adenylate cyclase [Bryobacteraceae bacterium]